MVSLTQTRHSVCMQLDVLVTALSNSTLETNWFHLPHRLFELV